MARTDPVAGGVGIEVRDGAAASAQSVLERSPRHFVGDHPQQVVERVVLQHQAHDVPDLGHARGARRPVGEGQAVGPTEMVPVLHRAGPRRQRPLRSEHRGAARRAAQQRAPGERVLTHGGGHYRRMNRMLLNATRVWLPVAIAVAGVVGIVIGRGHTAAAAAGVGLIIAALIVWLLNWMYRMSIESNRDREREEEARRYFDRHGRWPDE